MIEKYQHVQNASSHISVSKTSDMYHVKNSTTKILQLLIIYNVYLVSKDETIELVLDRKIVSNVRLTGSTFGQMQITVYKAVQKVMQSTMEYVSHEKILVATMGPWMTQKELQ